MPDTTDTDATYRVTADELREIVEPIEKIKAEIADRNELIKERLAHAKSRGYEPKIIRKCLALRKRSKDEIAEEDAVTQMYMEALG